MGFHHGWAIATDQLEALARSIRTTPGARSEDPIVGLVRWNITLRDATGDRLLAACAGAVTSIPVHGWDDLSALIADATWTPPPGRVLLVEYFDDLLRLDPSALEPLYDRRRHSAVTAAAAIAQDSEGDR